MFLKPFLDLSCLIPWQLISITIPALAHHPSYCTYIVSIRLFFFYFYVTFPLDLFRFRPLSGPASHSPGFLHMLPTLPNQSLYPKLILLSMATNLPRPKNPLHGDVPRRQSLQIPIHKDPAPFATLNGYRTPKHVPKWNKYSFQERVLHV